MATTIAARTGEIANKLAVSQPIMLDAKLAIGPITMKALVNRSTVLRMERRQSQQYQGMTFLSPFSTNEAK